MDSLLRRSKLFRGRLLTAALFVVALFSMQCAQSQSLTGTSNVTAGTSYRYRFSDDQPHPNADWHVENGRIKSSTAITKSGLIYQGTANIEWSADAARGRVWVTESNGRLAAELDVVIVLGAVNAGPDRTYCKEVGSINLSDWGLSLSLGSWSGRGVVGQTISLSSLAPGTYPYTYRRNADGKTDEMQLTVVEANAGRLSDTRTSSCPELLSGALVLSGYVGDILRWEKSYDHGTTWIDIASALASLTYLETQPAQFRVVVRVGNCPLQYSNIINVDALAVEAGEIHSDGLVTSCTAVTGTLSLAGNNGDVVGWEQSFDDSQWTVMPGTSAMTSIDVDEDRSVGFRVVVQRGACAARRTAAVYFSPQKPIGGTVTVAALSRTCGHASGSLTLQDYKGQAVWQYKTTAGDWTSTDNADITHNFDLTEQTSFRVKVEDGSCSEEYSNEVTVHTSTQPGSIHGSTPETEACNAADLRLELSGNVGQIIAWQYSPDASTWVDLPNSRGQRQYAHRAEAPQNFYRASVALDDCAPQYTPAYTFAVSAPTVAGIVTVTEARAPETVNGVLTFYPVFHLQQAIGSVQHWIKTEEGREAITLQSNATDLPQTLVKSAGYRADVKSGSCEALLSGQAFFVINPAFVGTLEVFGHTIISTYDGHSYTVRSDDGVTIQDGFTFIANSGQSFFVMLDNDYSVPQPAQNYILEETILEKGLTDDQTVRFANAHQKESVYSYADGLGRIRQQVSRRASPQQRDMITPFTYDALGRSDKTYQSYTGEDTDGRFKEDALLQQSLFYAAPPAKIAATEYPYSETKYEPGPLNRVVENGAPGADWQPGIGHTTKAYVRVNEADDVTYWKIDNSSPYPRRDGFYAAGQLLINVVVDEHLKQTREYRNKEGKTILKRVELADGWNDTYYIYDNLGWLRYVIQPEGVAQLTAQPDEAFANTWMFQYRYDQNGRTIAKRVPGGDWEYFVYDNRDRLVLSQNSQQRGAHQWSFTKYDARNRPVVVGLYTATDATDQHVLSHDELSTLISTTQFNEAYEGTTALHGYTNTVFPTQALDVMQVFYYDRYDFVADLFPGDYHYEKEPSHDFEEHAADRVNGLLTGQQTRVLGTPNLLHSVTWYDDKYRVIQTLSDNALSGRERSSFLLDFAGRLKNKVVRHTTGQTSWVVLEEFAYDHRGRLLQHNHQMGAGPTVVLKQQHYNAVGQLIEKNLHIENDGAYRQSIDYTYNERGWLTHINNATLTHDAEHNDDATGHAPDLFGFELKYNDPLQNATPQYNGNISQVLWKNQAGHQQAYDFSYDHLNRLTEAAYRDVSTPLRNGMFDERVPDYDRNGNIRALQRYGKNVYGIASVIDRLRYGYDGNRLLTVTDDVTDAAGANGFNDGNKTGNDYTYTAGGSMSGDNNKDIAAIAYNHLNLATTVTKKNAEHITYTYDATGRKLTQTVFDAAGNPVKKTDYNGEQVFENNVLQFMHHAEGRVVMTGATPEYQYFLKDHLGNVRTTFTTKAETDAAMATLEPAKETEELSKFLFLEEAVKINSALFDHTNNGTTHNATRLNGRQHERTGLTRSLSVMPGDVIRAEVFVKYIAANNWQQPLIDLLQSIATGGAASPLIDGGALGSPGIYVFPYNDMIVEDKPEQNSPRGFLNIMAFDRDQHLVDFKVVQMNGEEGAEDGTNVAHQKLELEYKISEAGFVFVYLSNDSFYGEEVEVFFDDFEVEQVKSPVVQTEDYYPFGLTFNSHRREGGVANRYQYNAKELQDALGLGFYDYVTRQYDPALGRFLSIDPAADLMRRYSIYSYAFDNPIRFTDPDGMVPTEGDPKTKEQQKQPELTIGQEVFLFIFSLLDRAGEALDEVHGREHTGDHMDHVLSAEREIGDMVLGLQAHSELVNSGAGPGAKSVSSEVEATASKVVGNADVELEFSANLEARAKELHGLLKNVKTRDKTTIAVGDAIYNDTGELATLVSSSEGSLRKSQRAVLRPGELEVSGEYHAEKNLVNYSNNNNMTLRRIAASRPICDGCIDYMLNNHTAPASIVKQSYLPVTFRNP